MANVQNAESDKIAAEAAKIAEEICKEIPAYDGATTKEEFDDIVSIIERALSQSLAARDKEIEELAKEFRLTGVGSDANRIYCYCAKKIEGLCNE